MGLPRSFLVGLWMTIATLVESNVMDYTYETDSCLHSIVHCSEFRVPLSVVKPHMLKLYTKEKDLKNVCKKATKFILCIQGAKEICKKQPSSPWEKELLKMADFARHLCENSFKQYEYLVYANCINSLLPEAGNCLSVGVKNAEKTASSSEAMCRLQTSVRNCLVQITERECGFVGANIHQKLLSFERGLDFACYDFEKSYKNTGTDSFSGSSPRKHESKESVKPLTDTKSVRHISENMENPLKGISRGISSASVSHDAQSCSSSKDQNNHCSMKTSKESATSSGTYCISKVDTSTFSSKYSKEKNIPSTAETSEAEPFQSKVNPSSSKYPITSDELSTINIVIQYIDNAVLITELLLKSVKYLHSEESLKSKYSKADIFNTELFNDMISGVDSNSHMGNTCLKNTKSTIVTKTACAADESSCSKMHSDSSHSEARLGVSSKEHEHPNFKTPTEMHKRSGDIVSPRPRGDNFTHENITTFSLYEGWSKKKKYLGCGTAKIMWKNELRLKKLYCGKNGPEHPEVLLPCTILTGTDCAIEDSIQDPEIIGLGGNPFELELVIYGQERNGNELKKRAIINVGIFKPNKEYLEKIRAEWCEKRHMEELTQRFQRLRSQIDKRLREGSEPTLPPKKKTLLHRSGLMFNPCTSDLDGAHKRLPQCNVDYVLVGNPYYPQLENESDKSEDTIYFVKASVKIAGAIRLKHTSFKNA